MSENAKNTYCADHLVGHLILLGARIKNEIELASSWWDFYRIEYSCIGINHRCEYLLRLLVDDSRFLGSA